MKIAILTFHYSEHNFGALLQTYASHTLLNNLGFEPWIMNLKPSNKGLLSRIKGVISSLLKKSYQFDRFRSDNFKITKTLYTFEDCKTQSEAFDAFYVGSDQVWRPKMAKERLYRYFLDFVDEHKIKISYAASFGTDKWEGTPEQATKIAKLLKRFSSVSVREDSGVDICLNEFGVKANHVLDPTLLLTENDYAKIESENNLSKDNQYVAYYMLDDINGLGRVIKSIRKEFGSNTFNLFGETKQFLGKKFIQYGSVGRWLSGIKNSTYVVTDSFHCVVFSIIYRKRFICLLNKHKGTSRIQSLLSFLGLENRICSQNNVDLLLLNEPINYDEVCTKLERLKKDSLSFLESALNIS